MLTATKKLRDIRNTVLIRPSTHVQGAAAVRKKMKIALNHILIVYGAT